MLCSRVAFDNASSFIFMNFEQPVFRYADLNTNARMDIYNQFSSGLYRLSPYFNSVISVRGEEGFYGVRDVAPDDFGSTVYYSLFYERKEVVDEGLFFIKDRNNGLVFMVERSAAHECFSEEEIASLRSCLPVVKAVLAGELAAPAPEAGAAPPDVGFDRGAVLSAREQDVASLILQGHSSKSAARILGISPHTEKVHRKRLYRRLGISSHTDLFRLYAKEIGVLEPRQDSGA